MMTIEIGFMPPERRSLPLITSLMSFVDSLDDGTEFWHDEFGPRNDGVELKAPPLIANLPAEPRYVCGVAGKPVGTVEHESLDAARAEAKRLANLERRDVHVLDAINGGEDYEWSVIETILPDPLPTHKTLADVEAFTLCLFKSGWSNGHGWKVAAGNDAGSIRLITSRGVMDGAGIPSQYEIDYDFKPHDFFADVLRLATETETVAAPITTRDGIDISVTPPPVMTLDELADHRLYLVPLISGKVEIRDRDGFLMHEACEFMSTARAAATKIARARMGAGK